MQNQTLPTAKNKHKFPAAFLTYPTPGLSRRSGGTVRALRSQLDAGLVRLHVQIPDAKPPELHDSTKLGLSRVPGDIQLVFVPHQDGFVAVLRVPHTAAPAQVRVGRR